MGKDSTDELLKVKNSLNYLPEYYFDVTKSNAPEIAKLLGINNLYNDNFIEKFEKILDLLSSTTTDQEEKQRLEEHLIYLIENIKINTLTDAKGRYDDNILDILIKNHNLELIKKLMERTGKNLFDEKIKAESRKLKSAWFYLKFTEPFTMPLLETIWDQEEIKELFLKEFSVKSLDIRCSIIRGKEEKERKKYKEKFELLLNKVDPKFLIGQTKEDKKNTLHILANYKNLEAIKQVLAKLDKKDIENMLKEEDKDNKTPLTISYDKDFNAQLREVLCDAGINIETESTDLSDTSVKKTSAKADEGKMGVIRRFSSNILSPISISLAIKFGSKAMFPYRFVFSPIFNLVDYIAGKKMKTVILNTIIEIATYVGIGMLFGAFGITIGLGYLAAASASANIAINLIDENIGIVESYKFRDHVSKSSSTQQEVIVR